MQLGAGREDIDRHQENEGRNVPLIASHVSTRHLPGRARWTFSMPIWAWPGPAHLFGCRGRRLRHGSWGRQGVVMAEAGRRGSRWVLGITTYGVAGGLSLAGARIPMRLLDMPPAALTWARAAGLSRWRWGLTRDGGCSTGWKGSCLLGNPMRRVECLEKSRVGGVSTMSSSSTPTPGIRRGRSRQREGRTSKHVQNLPVWADSGATWAAGNRRQRVWHRVGVGRRRLVSPTHPWAMRCGLGLIV